MERSEVMTASRRWRSVDDARAELQRLESELDNVQGLIQQGGNMRASNARKLEKRGGQLLAAKADIEEVVEFMEAKQIAHDLIPPSQQDIAGHTTFGSKSWPAVDGELYSEQTYRPDGDHSFIRDVVFAAEDPGAQERLRRNQVEVTDQLVRRGDVTTADPGMAGIVPPLYLGDLYAETARPARPYADAVGAQRLQDSGMTVTIPRLTTPTIVGSQVNQADAVAEQDADTDTLTSPVVTIAGQQDVSRQAIERTLPTGDVVLMRDLLAAYDAELDRQLLNGLGSSGQHRGLAHVTGPNTVTYAAATPTGKLCLKSIGNAMSQVATNRFLQAEAVVMHPRRAADLGTQFDSENPLLPLGSAINRAIATQAGGSPNNIVGLSVVVDPNIPTNTGAGTNQDTIYVVRLSDQLLWESQVRSFKFEQVLSGTLQIRLQVYSYSAFMADRWPKSIAVISGTGLVAPTFT